MKNALLSIKRKKYRMSFRKLIDDTRFLKFKVTSTNGKMKPKIFPQTIILMLNHDSIHIDQLYVL